MTDSSDSATRVKPVNVRLWLFTFAGLLLITFVVATAALVKAYQPRPQKGTTDTGTWYCETSTGHQTAVGNPANCGPNDLVGWCEVWETSPTGGGKCVS